MTEPTKKLDIEAVLDQHKVLIQQVLEKWLPRKFTQESLEHVAGKPRYAYDTESATKAVLEPIWNILDRGGKRWRPALLLLIAEAFGAKIEDVADFVYLCEIVHNGTLVVDDIEDDSQLRRGQPCLHLIYKIDVAINAGMAMYYLPLVVLRDKRGKLPEHVLVKAYELYGQEMINIHFGQGLDIWWHQGHANPTIDQYLQMCAYKTGTLARLSAKLSALVSGANDQQVEAIGTFAESIGVAFQIQDDILNLVGEKFAKIKGTGEDIHEGKRTLMVLHSLQHATKEKADRLVEILNLHTNDEALIREAIAIIDSNGSIDYARQVAKDIISKAWKEVDPILPENQAKEKLRLFADYLVNRDI